MKKIILIASLFLITAEAQSYQLRTTKNGDFIRWGQQHIKIVLDDSLETLGPIEDVKERIMEAFEMWEDNAMLEVRFTFKHGKCDQIGYTQNGQNHNCVMASDDESMWDRAGHHDPGASAVVSFNPNNGKIVDGDIAFNVLDWNWSLDGNEKGKLDIRSIAVHEIGHLLGLDHSEIEEAIMYPISHLGGESIFELHNDDVLAANALYDENWTRTTQTSDLNSDILEADCDGRSVAAGSTPSFSLFFLGFLALLLWRRRYTCKAVRNRTQGRGSILS